MYVVVFSFVTNPVLTAASVICVTTTSVAVTDQPSISISCAYSIDCHVPLNLFHLDWSLYSVSPSPIQY
jgi:hypothetical protein